MKSCLLRTVVATAALTVTAFGSPAHATFVSTDTSFFTAPADGRLTFTYEGFSAADTDLMHFAFDGATIFTNNTTLLGTVVTVTVTEGQLFQLALSDLSTADAWSSDLSLNPDSNNHLVSTSAFSDFNIGAARVPVSTNCAVPTMCYLGWEDRPFSSADADFNDLVFAEQFTVFPTPEPPVLAILGTALVGLGWFARRQHNRG